MNKISASGRGPADDALARAHGHAAPSAAEGQSVLKPGSAGPESGE